MGWDLAWWGQHMGTVTVWGSRSRGIWLLMAVVLSRGSQATVGAPGRHRLLEKELRELQAAERQLDDLIQTCTVQLRLLTEDPANQQYPSVQGWEGAGWRGGAAEPHSEPSHIAGRAFHCPSRCRVKASLCLLLDLSHHSLRDLPGSPQHCGPRGANGDGYQSPPRDPAAGLRPSGGELGPPSAPCVCTALSKAQPRLPWALMRLLVLPFFSFPRLSRSLFEALRAPSMSSSAPRTAQGSVALSRAPSKPPQRSHPPAIRSPEPPRSCIPPRT